MFYQMFCVINIYTYYMGSVMFCVEDSSYTLQHLENKLKKKTFETKIKFEELNNKTIILNINFPLSKILLG